MYPRVSDNHLLSCPVLARLSFLSRGVFLSACFSVDPCVCLSVRPSVRRFGVPRVHSVGQISPTSAISARTSTAQQQQQQ